MGDSASNHLILQFDNLALVWSVCATSGLPFFFVVIVLLENYRMRE